MTSGALPNWVQSEHGDAVRVMHVVHCLGANGRTGGMEYGVIKITNGLDRRRVLSAICSTRPADPAITGLLDRAVPHFQCEGEWRGNDPRVVLSLARLFRRFAPDIVHTHAWGTMLEGLLAARLAGVPIVVHGEHGTLQLKWHQRLAQRWGWRLTDQVVSVSSRLAEKLSREIKFPLELVRTLRNGVDLSRFQRVDRTSAREILAVGTDEKVIVIAGRLVPVKDHQTLLMAMQRLSESGVRPRLLVAGDGPLASELAARADALGVAGQVRWLGHRPDVEVVFAAADLFVLSSVSEGMSNTILEAMAAGLPVVATRVGGADELVIHGETGLLVPASSPDELAQALREVILNDDVRTAMGAAGLRRAVAEFSLGAMIGRYEALYLELARDKGRREPAQVAAV